MIKINCDQTREDLTGKPHISVTRNALRFQDGKGGWKPVSPWAPTGVLYFKDGEALGAWIESQKEEVEEDEWYTSPAKGY